MSKNKRKTSKKYRIRNREQVLNKSNDNNCLRNYLLNNYKITSKVINKLGNKDGITPCEIKQFCIKYNIKLILFNVECDIIVQYSPEKKNKSYKFKKINDNSS